MVSGSGFSVEPPSSLLSRHPYFLYSQTEALLKGERHLPLLGHTDKAGV